MYSARSFYRLLDKSTGRISWEFSTREAIVAPELRHPIGDRPIDRITHRFGIWGSRSAPCRAQPRERAPRPQRRYDNLSVVPPLRETERTSGRASRDEKASAGPGRQRTNPPAQPLDSRAGSRHTETLAGVPSDAVHF